MALLWCDGFEHYGTDTTRMVDGLWSTPPNVLFSSMSTDSPRTGNYSLLVYSGAEARRALGKTVTTLGFGLAFRMSGLPGTPNQSFWELRDKNNVTNLTLVVQTTGILQVWRGTVSSGTMIVESDGPVIRARSWSNIETMATFDNTTGSVEVRLNGVTVINKTALDTVSSSGAAECSQIILGGSSVATRYGDMYVYDTSGSYNNTWMGDRRVRALTPSADTAQADWTGSYTDIDDLDPDDDTTYLSANTPGSPSESSSEFDLSNLPVTAGDVAAVVTVTRSTKDEAGVADLQTGVVSGGSENRGDVKQITQGYTYREDIFETDPNSGVPFTGSDVDGLKLQINRV